MKPDATTQRSDADAPETAHGQGGDRRAALEAQVAAWMAGRRRPNYAR